jgi:[ribosomal protein S18]-alanine N-acetyltransferase
VSVKTLRFVPLAEEHLADVVAIEKASQSAPWSEHSFRNEVDHKDGLFLVALLEGKVVGFAGAWVLVDEAHVTNVAVDPERRRAGIGRRLVSALLEGCREKGATCATLEVRAGNAPAIALYGSFGFVRAGVRKRYYPDNREDAVVMWLHGLEGVGA